MKNKEEKTALYNVVKRYFDNTPAGNLFLLTMPVGSGKSYSVERYITDKMTKDLKEHLSDNMKSSSKKKFFFITDKKVNLPVEEIREMCVNNGMSKKDAQKSIVFLNGLVENVKLCYRGETKEKKEAWEQLEASRFGSTDEFNTLKGYLSLKTNDKNIANGINEKTEEAEKNFRACVQKEINKKVESKKKENKKRNIVESVLKEMERDPDYAWLQQVYPSVFYRQGKVFFLSIDKLMTPLVTLVEFPFSIYNDRFWENSCVIIDEFDASKGRILNKLIESGLRNNTDCISILRRLNEAFSNEKKFTVDFYENSNNETYINELRDRVAEVYKKYHMECPFRTEDDEEKTDVFIFQDFISRDLSDKSYNFYYDEERNENVITDKDVPAGKTEYKVSRLLEEVSNVLRRARRAFNWCANNYLVSETKKKDINKENFTYEYALSSIMHRIFGCEDASFYYEYFKDFESIGKRKQATASKSGKKEVLPSSIGNSLYSHGFSYYLYENSYTHKMDSIIRMNAFYNAPECFLERICEKATVIGLSATAECPSILCNYDLEYIKLSFGDRLHLLSQERHKKDQMELEEEYDRLWKKKYEENNIHVSTEFFHNAITELTENWMQEEKIQNMILAKHWDTKDPEYWVTRYCNIALAYKRFCETDSMQSFLCFLSAYPQKGETSSYTLNMDVLENLFRHVNKNQEIKYEILRTENFKTDKKRISKRLAAGEKIFVMTHYECMGAGQNFVYPVPKCRLENLLILNEARFNEKMVKDFDGIYCEMPTRIIPQVSFINKDWTSRSDENINFATFLYDLQYLYQAAEISSNNLSERIKDAFQRRYSGTGKSFKHKEIPSYRLGVTMKIQQAVGRICRSVCKNKTIYLFASEEVAECLTERYNDTTLMNVEFREMINEAYRYMGHTVSTKDRDIAIANQHTKNSSSFLDYLLPTDTKEWEWVEQKMKRYTAIGEIYMRNPAADPCETSEDEYLKESVESYYVKNKNGTGKYWFKYDEATDLEDICISYSKSSDFRHEVSADRAGLPRLLKVDGIPEYFERHEWAKEWSGEYLISPPIFRRFYLGRLGEGITDCMFEKFFEGKLYRIEPEEKNGRIFELFDFYFDDLPVWVDAKHWSKRYLTRKEKEDFIRKIVEKSERLNQEKGKDTCKCVLITKIFADDTEKFSVVERNNIKICFVPRLITEDNNWDVKMIAQMKEVINEFCKID